MQNILNVKVDTASMTLEELKTSRDKLRDEIAKTKDQEYLYKLRHILSNVNHQILMRMLLANRYSS